MDAQVEARAAAGPMVDPQLEVQARAVELELCLGHAVWKGRGGSELELWVGFCWFGLVEHMHDPFHYLGSVWVSTSQFSIVGYWLEVGQFDRLVAAQTAVEDAVMEMLQDG